ncbi:MAG: hypothetical protein CVV27_13265 [Candidatus Melainabacteria bacterium HGW-Melainabacteria-1]|nr:MAG: hypothetical protein CVV27_13265 [Candidatus Melainabacteria bacterium HGW-Melainabacteria-1]
MLIPKSRHLTALPPAAAAGELFCLVFVVCPNLLMALLLLLLGYGLAQNRTLKSDRTVRRQLKTLRAERVKLAARNRQLERLALEDPLTGVPNRRHFDRQLHKEWLRCRRQTRPLALLLSDVDDFKRYNDCCGHPAGDACLQDVADAIQQSLKRPGDFVARYGGEEFAIVLPDTDPEGAQHVAEQIRQNLCELALPHPASADGRVSLSIGLAHADGTGSLDQLIEAADRALYVSKARGKDRISVGVPR